MRSLEYGSPLQYDWVIIGGSIELERPSLSCVTILCAYYNSIICLSSGQRSQAFVDNKLMAVC
jgi:hypothetical protein